MLEIIIPERLIRAAKTKDRNRQPPIEQQEQAKLAIPLLKTIIFDYQAAINAIQKEEYSIFLGQEIGSQFRHTQTEKGIYVVRFCSDFGVSEPHKKSYWNAMGIGVGLEIAYIKEKTPQENPLGGWSWSATGVLISPYGSAATRVHYLGSGSYTCMDDIIGKRTDEFDITTDKIASLAEVQATVNNCFSPEEIKLSIIQTLINDADK
jgi:hypothetical protein